MEGEISIFSVKKQKRVFFHETLPGMIQEEFERRTKVKSAKNGDDEIDIAQITRETSNVLYSCHTVKGIDELEGFYLVGDEQGNINKYYMDLNLQK